MLVVIRDFDFLGMSILPTKADPILLVDSDAVLSFPSPLEPFQPVTGGYGELCNACNPIELIQLPAGGWP